MFYWQELAQRLDATPELQFFQEGFISITGPEMEMKENAIRLTPGDSLNTGLHMERTVYKMTWKGGGKIVVRQCYNKV